MFPKCNKQTKKSLTRLLDAHPRHHYHEDTDPMDEEVTPPCRSTRKGKERQREEPAPPQVKGEHPPEPPSDPEEEAPPLPRRASPPAPPLGPRRSTRIKNIPKKPDNVYGDCHPVGILRDPTGRKGRRTVQGPVPRPKENIPGPSRIVPEQPQQRDWDPALPPISLIHAHVETESRTDISHPAPARGCQDGG